MSAAQQFDPLPPLVDPESLGLPCGRLFTETSGDGVLIELDLWGGYLGPRQLTPRTREWLAAHHVGRLISLTERRVAIRATDDEVHDVIALLVRVAKVAREAA